MLPPNRIFYENMENVNVFCIIISILLTICIGLNVFSTVLIYGNHAFSYPTIKSIFSMFVLSLAFMGVTIITFGKINAYFKKINNYKVYPKIKNVLKILILIICGLGIYLTLNIDKNVFVYAFFMSGMIYYMTTFIVLKSMKKHYFSFRMIILDCLTIGTLAISSAYYPVNSYEIPSMYKLLGVCLIIIVVILNGSLIFILVNIVKKEMKEKKDKKKKYNNMNEESIP